MLTNEILIQYHTVIKNINRQSTLSECALYIPEYDWDSNLEYICQECSLDKEFNNTLFKDMVINPPLSAWLNKTELERKLFRYKYWEVFKFPMLCSDDEKPLPLDSYVTLYFTDPSLIAIEYLVTDSLSDFLIKLNNTDRPFLFLDSKKCINKDLICCIQHKQKPKETTQPICSSESFIVHFTPKHIHAKTITLSTDDPSMDLNISTLINKSPYKFECMGSDWIINKKYIRNVEML